MATKNAAAKTAKKVSAPKPAKVAKPSKNVIVKRAEVELISFTVSAVIPTQQYGNIQPKIEVRAGSIEEARAVVMPIIENLYQTYAEMPLNGREPKFYGKIEVEEKVVSTGAQKPLVAPKAAEPASVSGSSVAAPEAAPEPSVSTKPKSEPVLKAEKAISLAMSDDALQVIQGQIEKSVKIAPEDKPALTTLVLKRRSEFNK